MKNSRGTNKPISKSHPRPTESLPFDRHRQETDLWVKISGNIFDITALANGSKRHPASPVSIRPMSPFLALRNGTSAIAARSSCDEALSARSNEPQRQIHAALLRRLNPKAKTEKNNATSDATPARPSRAHVMKWENGGRGARGRGERRCCGG